MLGIHDSKKQNAFRDLALMNHLHLNKNKNYTRKNNTENLKD